MRKDKRIFEHQTPDAMKKECIGFSYNWNGKLSNKVFITIRLHNPKKYRAGQSYLIELKGKTIGTATMINKFVTNLGGLTDYVCYMDTGYSKADTVEIFRRMYKNTDLNTVQFDLCLLKFDPPVPQQGDNDRPDKNE
jgi:hypothetical protein